jgi:hypothetical protein
MRETEILNRWVDARDKTCSALSLNQDGTFYKWQCKSDHFEDWIKDQPEFSELSDGEYSALFTEAMKGE